LIPTTHARHVKSGGHEPSLFFHAHDNSVTHLPVKKKFLVEIFRRVPISVNGVTKPAFRETQTVDFNCTFSTTYQNRALSDP